MNHNFCYSFSLFIFLFIAGCTREPERKYITSESSPVSAETLTSAEAMKVLRSTKGYPKSLYAHLKKDLNYNMSWHPVEAQVPVDALHRLEQQGLLILNESSGQDALG